jgi:bifunctional non-homologous end joining protein LigD
MHPKIMLGPDKKMYTDYVYNHIWASYERVKRTPTFKALWNDFNQHTSSILAKKGGIEKSDHVIQALRQMGVEVRPYDGKLIRHRQRPERHIRTTETGKKIVVNKGLIKPKPFPSMPPKPMLAKEGAEFAKKEGWLTERKFDGARLVTVKRGNTIRLFSRSGLEYTQNFPELVRALRQLRAVNTILDGEVVYLDKNGNDHIEQVQSRIQIKDPGRIQEYVTKYPVHYFIFDILEFDQYGNRVQKWPLIKRKGLLQHVVPDHKVILTDDEDKRIHLTEYADHMERRQHIRKVQEQLHREGVMHKDPQSAYVEDYRSGSWRKDKFKKTADVILIGYSKGQGHREGKIGALYTAQYDKHGKLTYTGKVGTGMNDQELEYLGRQLNMQSAMQIGDSFNEMVEGKLSKPEIAEGRWVVPYIVVEIEFMERSKDNHFRHGVFLRQRLDKKAAEAII